MAQDVISSASWIQGHLDVHGEAIRRRRLTVHCEFDAGFHLAPDAALDAALDRLIRFALATVPDECEVYLATSRALAPVAALGDGSLTARWQVLGSMPPSSPQPDVARLHPIAGEAATHVASRQVVAIREAFGAAGWSVEFGSVHSGREIFVRAERRLGSGGSKRID